MKSRIEFNSVFDYPKEEKTETVPNKFIKEVAKVGDYISSDGSPWSITKELFDAMINNFRTMKDKVPVPNGHKGMDDVMANCGWVEDLWRTGESLYAKFNITDKECAEKILEGSIQDNSIGVIVDNEDISKSYLEHIALCLMPAIAGLNGFELATFNKAEALEETKTTVYRLSKKSEEKMEETVTKVEFEKVTADLTKANEAVAEFEKAKAEFESVKVELSKVKAEFEAVVKERDDLKAEFSKKVDAEAELLIEKYIVEGKMTPAQKEIGLSMVKKDKAEFEAFIAGNKVIVLTESKELAKEETVKEFSKDDLRKMGKAEYAEFSKLLATGKAKLI